MNVDRDYISYSQFKLFKSSPKAYYEKYVLDKKSYGSKYQQFGKKLMRDLEFGENNDDVPEGITNWTAGKIIEQEITVESKYVVRNLYGIIDAFSVGYNHFIEIKTGKIPWDEARLLKDEQVLFYALMINLKYKVIPEAVLVWAETVDKEDGSIEFTGKVESFKRDFTLEELLKFQDQVSDVSFEIEEYEHSVLEVEVDRDAKLLELLSEKKRIDDELDLLRNDIMLDIKEFSDKYATSQNFNMTIAKRKKWKYSEALNKEIQESVIKNKFAKVKEQNEGVATFTETEYLMIKAKK